MFFTIFSFTKAIRFSVFTIIFCSMALVSQAQLTGIVTNQKGVPLEGANVYIPELKTGRVCDRAGFFAFEERLPEGNYTLRVSYVGYRSFSQPIDSKDKQQYSIILEEDPVLSGQIIVSATRADQRTPMTYTHVNKEALMQNNLGQDVPFILRWTPSAVVTSDAGTGIGYTGIWIRGSDPTRINVTINGIPLNDAESQNVFWVDLPDIASSTEDVQIQRGAGASTNGTGAFGATINLNTSKVNQDAYTSIDATLGSFNTLKGSLGFGTGLFKNGFTLDGRLSRLISDGYIDRAASNLRSWYLSGAWIGERSSLRLNAFSGHERTYQAWNGVAAEDVNDPERRTFNSAGTEKEGDPYENEIDNYGQTHLQLLFNHQFNEQWYLNLAAHYTKGGGFFEQYKADEDLLDYGLSYPISDSSVITTTTDLVRRRWLDNDFYGSTYSLHYDDKKTSLKATFGGAYNIYEGRHFGEIIWARFASNSELGTLYYDNNARKKDASIFAKANYNITPKLDAYVDLQLRSVAYDFTGIDNTGRQVDQYDALVFFNPKMGLQYHPAANSRIYASFSVAQREPNRNDYIGSTPSNRPKAEQLYDLEVGWSRQLKKMGFEANFYYMYYLDQLVLNGQINDVGALLRTNVDQSYRMGFEVAAGADITKKLHLLGNVTISRNKIISFIEYLDDYDADFNLIGQKAVKREDADLAFSPNLMGGLEIRYDLLVQQPRHDLSIVLRGKYIGRRFLDNSADAVNSLNPYFFSDWQVQYTLHDGWARKIRINLQLLNWLDKLYESNGWSYRYVLDGQEQLSQGLYPQAGRQLMLGLGLDF